jgi:hypothetical protein
MPVGPDSEGKQAAAGKKENEYRVPLKLGQPKWEARSPLRSGMSPHRLNVGTCRGTNNRSCRHAALHLVTNKGGGWSGALEAARLSAGLQRRLRRCAWFQFLSAARRSMNASSAGHNAVSERDGC